MLSKRVALSITLGWVQPGIESGPQRRQAFHLPTAPLRQHEPMEVRLLATRFEARNSFSEPGPQEPYRNILKNTLYKRKTGGRKNNAAKHKVLSE
jgi:hypothetical protein